MPPKNEVLVTQSLLDRLCDTDPWPQTRKESLAMFKQSLKRDIEWLLNTRRPLIPKVESYPPAATSVLCYGLPDAQIFHGTGTRNLETLKGMLQQCIEEFEPRIQQPQVSIFSSDPLNRSLHFQVEGVVRYEDMEEEIQIDTILELISGEYEVD